VATREQERSQGHKNPEDSKIFPSVDRPAAQGHCNESGNENCERKNVRDPQPQKILNTGSDNQSAEYRD
jgi:hypothetical protein